MILLLLLRMSEGWQTESRFSTSFLRLPFLPSNIGDETIASQSLAFFPLKNTTQNSNGFQRSSPPIYEAKSFESENIFLPRISISGPIKPLELSVAWQFDLFLAIPIFTGTFLQWHPLLRSFFSIVGQREQQKDWMPTDQLGPPWGKKIAWTTPTSFQWTVMVTTKLGHFCSH